MPNNNDRQKLNPHAFFFGSENAAIKSQLSCEQTKILINTTFENRKESGEGGGRKRGGRDIIHPPQPHATPNTERIKIKNKGS